MMGLNPIKTTQTITEQYLKYLNSLFFLKNVELMQQAEQQLYTPGKFVKGPFIEVTSPFVIGKSLKQLMDINILSREFELISKHFPLTRPLYGHQQKAIDKVVEAKRNIVVATGTGSGKTECFLLPIIDYLMKQKIAGKLNPGVRALFLYPMNALANDQVARLRTILIDYPDITFGRFTGKTPENEIKAVELWQKMNPDLKRLKNEIISREEMRNNPPHILLTNYAMLEYLLLRPDDNVLFDGENAREWHFIVLDEAHTYNGAKGTEIAMLLKRLKQRVVGAEQGQIQCIATSATLGGGKDAYQEVAEFAQEIFGEPFEVDDIIESERVDLTNHNNESVMRESNGYKDLQKLLDNDEHKELYNYLCNDANVFTMQSILKNGPLPLTEVAQKIFADEDLSNAEKEQVLIDLVNLCASAKNSKDDMPLLPARYHVFVKSLEGAFVSLYPHKKLFLDRHTSERLDFGKEVPVFELANCQRCGQEYLVGTTHEGKLLHLQTHVDIEGLHSDRIEFYMLSQEAYDEAFDEDEILLAQKDYDQNENVEPYVLCCGCGHIEKAGGKKRIQCCEYPQDKYIKVWRVKARENKVNSCYSCGAHAPDLIKRFLTADDPATEVLTKSLYQCIPPQKKEAVSKLADGSGPFIDEIPICEDDRSDRPLDLDEQGRKLLIFSDNRQEAAFFATYVNLKYNQVLWRNAILKVMDDLNKFDDIRLESVAQRLLDYGNRKGLFNKTLDEPQKLKMIYAYLMKEFIELERQVGLEGLGIINFMPKKPNRWGNLPDQSHLGVNSDGMWEIYSVLFDTLRTRGAVTFPKEIAPTDDFFAPRNRNIYFKMEAQKPFKQSVVLGWLPNEKSSNQRLDFIVKLLVKNHFSPEMAKTKAREILKRLLIGKIFDFFQTGSYISNTYIANEGTFLQLNYGMWNVTKNNTSLHRCDLCGLITKHNVNNVCPTYRCNGQLKRYCNEKTRFTYYKELYETMRSIPMVAKEHTAQLTSECASSLQNQFVQGEVNI